MPGGVRCGTSSANDSRQLWITKMQARRVCAPGYLFAENIDPDDSLEYVFLCIHT